MYPSANGIAGWITSELLVHPTPEPGVDGVPPSSELRTQPWTASSVLHRPGSMSRAICVSRRSISRVDCDQHSVEAVPELASERGRLTGAGRVVQNRIP